ncbi:PTS sugar transporter subunit IIC [Clostridium algidicarnis]|uniref:PTS sugar transporter subunit IIC n=1 Tax=Clostridium algidicarnis TaxID=37659 RepID=A0ABS6C1U2_9CLOT|nr:PTS sugar transporter subunit IIC [Clostridium algidicarnis]MBB6631373.1 PTS sugar transporter subunit IIC [Clostridium algidicarnis]MBB6697149.1 PTS sugar transporter subunit IIC [Clostridium algidicarnis]MBU3192431.1 PTS sugar transporter subunit IIC [Clostridium algidicarnis]MBU3204422.1 PTS sugar transporter subunit IIC [Clostridium algidicarnis]MBU3212495.1 PTS sugar transporter subunit IIC [Clostridium algidicarnis]
MDIIIGIGLLLFTLALFSLFSFKAPKGNKAMSGLANAAVATFLVEAIHKYISGDLLNLSFLRQVGESSGSMGGVAAAILVPIAMGVNPIYAVVAGVALGGYGILPGFVAGYIVGLVAPIIEKKLPEGLDTIVGALVIAPLARVIALGVDPIVNSTLISIGEMISTAAQQSPYVMGFLLGGIMKITCTSPLSSMALTAMIGLQGLAMGIAAIACVGGSFTNGIIFKKLKLGNKSNVIAVMLEPLTQAHIITKHPIPIYCSNFLGGGLAGLAAAYFKIINNAPGTASPIPGLLAPFGFNDPIKVVLALAFAIAGGTVAGLLGSAVFKNYGKSKKVASEETDELGMEDKVTA